MITKKYYVVWKGRKTGIFDNWEECEKQIYKFSGSEYKSFKTKEEAETNFAKSSQVPLLSLRREKMVAKDISHDAVKNALEKDGWKITDDPLILVLENTLLKADLVAEKFFTAEKNNQKIAVEVKDFDSASVISELEKTIGQMQFYQWALEEQEPDRKLFLAISQSVYLKHFQKPIFQLAIKRNQINLIVFDSQKEDILQWINQ